jgi:S1-C subfamily serine protease
MIDDPVSRGPVPAPHRPAQRLPGVAAITLLAVLATCHGAVMPGGAAEPLPAAPCREAIPDVFARVSPSVVFIAATSINPYRLSDRVTHTVGSGVLFDAAGLILTNSHVAFGRQSIRVTLDDGRSFRAELAGADPLFDVAVLRLVEPPEDGLPAAALGDSDALRVGDDVLAIGNPLGLDQTLTRGIVSAINRILPETPFSMMEPLIQTDASINPGNSGGPLLNRCGEVVGINTAVISEAQNIGFAIPINLVKTLLGSLVAEGRVIRPWLGFHGQIVDDSLRDLLRLPLVPGLLIEVLEPGSPAERVGLRGGRLELSIAGQEYLLGGDVITSLNGARLSSPEAFARAIRSLKVGDTVSLTVFRDEEYLELEYVLPERPLLPGDVSGRQALSSARAGAARQRSPAGASPRAR